MKEELMNLLEACSDLMRACDSLMSEVVGSGITNWELVNGALIKGGKAINAGNKVLESKGR